ncbi:MAG: hypothetical protein LIO46_04125 [Clostridiales bacterium]|nr:hypothetical protein [Clostridiales bacterium]
MKYFQRQARLLFSVLSLVLVFTACGSIDEPETSTVTTTTTETETEPETTQAEETSGAPAETTKTDAPITSSSSAAEVAAYYNTVMQASRAADSVRGTGDLKITRLKIPSIDDSILNQMDEALQAYDYEPMEDLELPLDDSVALKEEDIKSFNVKDNGSTLTLKIVPKAEDDVKESGKGPQGRSLGALITWDEFLGYLDEYNVTEQMLSFDGKAEDNIKFNYDGGYLELVIDKATNTIQSGKYVTVAELVVTNCKIMGFFTINPGYAGVQYTVTYH